MEAYSMQLAMAALVGASVAAVSAFYLHGETVNQILDLAKTLEGNKSYSAATDGGEEMDDLKRYYSRRRRGKGKRRRSRRGSGSSPDASKSSDLARSSDYTQGKLEVPMHGDVATVVIPRHHAFPEGTQLSDFSPGEL